MLCYDCYNLFFLFQLDSWLSLDLYLGAIASVLHVCFLSWDLGGFILAMDVRLLLH